MSVRDSLIKYLTSILRASEGTVLVLLCDKNGLSIAKIGRKSEIDLNPNQITSLASAAFSASEENWIDLNIKDQVISFSYFDKVCLITIRINETLLTIVHDYHKEWPLDADNLATSMYYLKQKLGELFGSGDELESEIERFCDKVRSAIYLFGMGSEVPFVSYTPESFEPSNLLPAISTILDSLQNPIFIRYGLVSPSGLTIDAREVSGQNLPLTVEAFSANANVAFQKMKEESEGSSIGDLLCYVALSGQNTENFYGLITCPSGKIRYSKEENSLNIEEISFIGLFSLSYGGIPIICESRNIIYSIMQILGEEQTTEKFIKSVNVLTSFKYE
ncbi:hypothetical protein LCGC14_0438490 [marine sediment metagenome]|uniref:Roadblock/LAMTOR2 domain-containing protein n=1 Tax=marine sediment metagenome TaxID=412755 RepID=A0A0F9SL09_9ZZZZ|nr:hypothetical protein [archaeon]